MRKEVKKQNTEVRMQKSECRSQNAGDESRKVFCWVPDSAFRTPHSPPRHSSLVTRYSLCGFTLIEVMLVVAIIAILATVVFYAGRAMVTGAKRQHTITLLKNLDALLGEWSDKVVPLRVFSDRIADVTNNDPARRTAFALWDAGWGDNMTVEPSKTNAVRWAYALSLQGDIKSALRNLPIQREGKAVDLSENYLYATAPLPAASTTVGYLYFIDKFDHPIVLMQSRMPRVDANTGQRTETSTSNVTRRSDKLYYFVSPGPDGVFGGSGSDDLYSTSE